MKFSELEKTLGEALNNLATKNGTPLQNGTYKKTKNGYIGKRKNGTYCSAFTLKEIKSKINKEQTK